MIASMMSVLANVIRINVYVKNTLIMSPPVGMSVWISSGNISQDSVFAVSSDAHFVRATQTTGWGQEGGFRTFSDLHHACIWEGFLHTCVVNSFLL